ncbi:uncharacterized protein LOC123707459 [Pieris brassicae]|uniref:uncharacterized protein LOC123707459 n=1 Tax=Pieris brassicae TaxID=7116 RepID=UPI001E65F86C|nr:uncharacterized protein LOC123707459 [Pieris brassicae]
MDLLNFLNVIALNVLLSLILIVSINSIKVDYDEDVLSRSRRQLLYPNSSVLQVNAGVGTPTPIKTINVNWAFQANFQLPWNRSQIPIDILEANNAYVGSARKKRRDGYESDAKLYHFYKYVEDVLSGFSYNGTACVLKTLCQLGTEPLQSYHEDDLLYELASFVLNPENDIAETEEEEATPYIKAYNDGKLGENCLNHNCPISLIDMFSKVHED